MYLRNFRPYVCIVSAQYHRHHHLSVSAALHFIATLQNLISHKKNPGPSTPSNMFYGTVLSADLLPEGVHNSSKDGAQNKDTNHSTD